MPLLLGEQMSFTGISVTSVWGGRERVEHCFWSLLRNLLRKGERRFRAARAFSLLRLALLELVKARLQPPKGIER